MKRKVFSWLMALILCLTLLPASAFAAEPAGADQTADFTADDGGEAAIALLTAAKWENAEAPTWDKDNKILTLKGISFTTAATTAVKLPEGTTIVLADGTHNVIRGGDADVSYSTEDPNRGYENKIYTYGIYAEGALTIRSDGDGRGTFSVFSGKHKNTGNAWTYAIALYAKGPLLVESGETTLYGGEAYSDDCTFSHALELPNGSGLSVTGGKLTAQGGYAYHKDSDGKYSSSFTRGIEASGADISVSGNGYLRTDSKSPNSLLAYGIDIVSGDLTVSDSAEVYSVAGNGIRISGGNLILTGGRIRAYSVAGGSDGLSVSKDVFDTGEVGNIKVTGGMLDAEYGGIYMYQYQPTEQQGQFIVSGSDTKVLAESISCAHKFTVGDAAVNSQEIAADELTLSSGSLTVRNPVQKLGDTLYADPALRLKKLTVDGGALDVSWYWGGETPVLLPVDESSGFSTPLVRMWGDDFIASFNGGTAKFDTGCAGNIVLKLGQLRLAEGVLETGADTSNADEHKQAADAVPVVFSKVQRSKLTTSVDAKSKVYDGTRKAVIVGGLLSGLQQESDIVGYDLDGLTATFAKKDVGEGIPVSVIGDIQLVGEDAYKYILEQLDMTNLAADITPADITSCAAFTDATDKNQSIYVGEGRFDAADKFTGFNGEAVSGTTSYNMNGTAVDVSEISAALKTLKDGEKLEITYTFRASGNYTGEITDKITVTAQKRSSSSSGGGSAALTYPVNTPSKTENGSVSVYPKNAAKGSIVTITVKPDDGCRLEALTAADKDGNALKLTDKGDGKYTFTMPAGKVEVKASFIKEAENSPFADVSASAYYYEAVRWAAEQGITGGIGENLFAPNQPCTRAQIVTFLWRAAGAPEPKGSAPKLTDVIAGSYYEKAVAWAIENGITNGTSAELFSPNDTCTRAQAVTFLARALNAKADGKVTFSDVPTDSYFADAVSWAASNGVTDGVGNGLFAPENDCTRAQIVTFLWRAYHK